MLFNIKLPLFWFFKVTYLYYINWIIREMSGLEWKSIDSYYLNRIVKKIPNVDLQGAKFSLNKEQYYKVPNI